MLKIFYSSISPPQSKPILTNCFLFPQDVFEDVSNYQVQPEEPHRLCENCGVRILEMFAFRKTLTETQVILEKLLAATVNSTVLRDEKPMEEENPQSDFESPDPLLEADDESLPVVIKEEQVVEIPIEEVDDEESFEIIEEEESGDTTSTKFVVYTVKGEPEEKKTPPKPVSKPYIREDGVLVDKLGREQKCHFCGSHHTTHASLLRHMRIKHPEMRTVPCEYCDLKMFSEKDRAYHYRICEKLRETKSVTEYTCPHCGIFVIGSNKLRMHMSSSHRIRTPNIAPFMCDICGKQLKNKHCLSVHMKIQHIAVQTFKCEFCNESYKSASGLKYHIAQHHSETTESFKCSICDFETKQEFLLRRHLKRHNPDKSYTCTTCGRSFASLDSLKSHVYTHTSDRPFDCNTCEKTFKSKAKLRNHARTHQGRRYECSLCASWYLTNQALRQHLQKQHPEYELPPPGTVMCETKAQLPKRIIRLEMR